MSLHTVKNYEVLESILSDHALNKEKKIEYLRSWAGDLENRLIAAEENMESEDSAQTSKDADLLQLVNQALLKLTENN